MQTDSRDDDHSTQWAAEVQAASIELGHDAVMGPMPMLSFLANFPEPPVQLKSVR